MEWLLGGHPIGSAMHVYYWANVLVRYMIRSMLKIGILKA